MLIKYGYGKELDSKEIASWMNGWESIVNNLIDELEALGWDGTLMQIKEKFGGLRFYIGLGSREMDAAISRAEEQSFKTCEECGKEGKLRTDRSWIKTLCNHHANDYNKNKNKEQDDGDNNPVVPSGLPSNEEDVCKTTQ